MSFGARITAATRGYAAAPLAGGVECRQSRSSTRTGSGLRNMSGSKERAERGYAVDPMQRAQPSASPSNAQKIQSPNMSKKIPNQPKPASQPVKRVPASQGIMPVVWVPNSLQEARTIKQSNNENATALRKALEKLVMAQCGLRLTTDEEHRYPVPNKGRVHAIRTGKGGSNLRLVYTEKDLTIYVLRVFIKQTDGHLAKAELQAIAAQWAKI